VYRPIGAPLDWVFGGRLPWYSYLSFAQNFWMAKANQIGPPILSPTWAFAVELQFYFVVPAIIRFVRRSALPYVFIVGIVIAPLVRIFVVSRFRANLLATYVLLPCRMDALFLGLLCAYCLREPEVWSLLVKRRNTLWIVLFVLIAGMPALNSKGIPFTFLWISVGYDWMSLFFATVLILALMDSQSLLSRAMRCRWLTGLGTISYGIYLFHYGIYGLWMWLLRGHEKQELLEWKDFGVTLFALAVSISFGKLSWRYFEKPIVRWSHNWQY
jgi:peptidoglycan/LPS O-acetylase OafA/YrhL